MNVKSMLPNSLKLTWLNLLRNGRRSLLSMLIIAIAVFALTCAGGYGLYSYDSLKEMAVRESGHLTLSQPDYFEKDEEMPLSNGLSNTEEMSKQILTYDEVRAVQPRIYFTGLVSNGSKSTIFIGTGVNEREFELKGPFLDVRSGSVLNSTSSVRYNPAEPQVMLAKDLAKNLNVEVGDWVTLLATTADGALNAYDFTVKGIYSTGTPELDKRQLYIHISLAQELLSTNKVSTLSVFLLENDDTEKMQQAIERDIPTFNADSEIEITHWQDLAFFYKSVKDLYNGIFGMMGGVMALVVFVALFNTMTMSVTERTREIGTLSALGAYPREIITDFLKEAGLLALLGSLAGAVSYALVSIILSISEIQMPPPPGSTEGYPLQVYFSLGLIAYATAGVVSLCLLTAFLSARRGVRKPITEALIYV